MHRKSFIKSLASFNKIFIIVSCRNLISFVQCIRKSFIKSLASFIKICIIQSVVPHGLMDTGRVEISLLLYSALEIIHQECRIIYQDLHYHVSGVTRSDGHWACRNLITFVQCIWKSFIKSKASFTQNLHYPVSGATRSDGHWACRNLITFVQCIRKSFIKSVA